MSLIGTTLGLALLGTWKAGILRTWFSTSKQEASEPGLFKKHSSFESFTAASGYTYPRIRVFYHEHPQAAKLPKGLPLLVFMHGLGGNATQFAPLLTSLVNIAPCLAIDLPGSGLSDFEPNDLGAYTVEAFAELLHVAIGKYRDAENNQQVILIGHSMGCSITVSLASSTSPLRERLNSKYIIGMVAICPLATSPSAPVERLKWLPVPVFDLVRSYDRLGGLNSASITRIVGPGADEETRKLQFKYNQQSRSAVWLRTVINSVPAWPKEQTWAGVKVPLFLVAGESDRVTQPEEVEKIAAMLSYPAKSTATTKGADIAPDQQTFEAVPGHESNENTVPTTTGDAQLAEYRLSKEGHSSGMKEPTADSALIKDAQKTSKHSFALKTSVFPAPAAHGLLYATSTVRILAGLIEGFLSHHIDERLTLGWQLQHMTTSGKWDVKNLKKWQSVDPCSAPIAGVFRAMKTMREIDDTHQPREFVKHFSSRVLPDGVAMVVDISHESPVYDSKGLEENGVEYHKLPTVSKLPPTVDEVEHFVSLIDQLRRSEKMQPKDGSTVHPTCGVHCHYGFNRTGVLIISYLVERLGYRVQDAIDEFAEKRPPGIKHQHFINELYVRYAVKMQRRGTIVG